MISAEILKPIQAPIEAYPRSPHYIDGPFMLTEPNNPNKWIEYHKSETQYAPWQSGKAIVTHVGIRTQFTDLARAEEKRRLEVPEAPRNVTQLMFGITAYEYPNGKTVSMITVPCVDAKNESTFDQAFYTDDGTLHRGVSYMGYANHDVALKADHYGAAKLPPQIDFSATVQSFMDQINGVNTEGKPVYSKPTLIPAKK